MESDGEKPRFSRLFLVHFYPWILCLFNISFAIRECVEPYVYVMYFIAPAISILRLFGTFARKCVVEHPELLSGGIA